MIHILGVKRILTLIILLAANAALAAVIYLYVIPENDSLSRNLASTRAQIGQERTSTDRLRNEFDAIQQDKNRFEALEAFGFMSDQNRLAARRRIMDIQKYTRVLRAGYNINAAVVERNARPGENTSSLKAGVPGYAILSSPITVDIEAMDDLDVYNFIYWMENAFPGYVMLDHLVLSRTREISDVVIRQIGSGVPTVLVRGKLNFTWRTMVPEATINHSDFAPDGFENK